MRESVRESERERERERCIWGGMNGVYAAGYSGCRVSKIKDDTLFKFYLSSHLS
jgi:hypothetical protein